MLLKHFRVLQAKWCKSQLSIPLLTAINIENNSNQVDGEPTAPADTGGAHCRWQWREEELVLLAQKAIWRPSSEEPVSYTHLTLPTIVGV